MFSLFVGNLTFIYLNIAGCLRRGYYDKVKYALENLLRAYRANREPGEPFGKFVDRHENEQLAEFLGIHPRFTDSTQYATASGPLARIV